MKKTLALATGIAALAVAGCGGGNDNSSSNSSSSNTQTSASTTPAASPSSGGGASTSLKLSADPSGSLKFDKSSLSAKSGNVTIAMDNPADVPHGVAVEGNGLNKVGATVNKGGKSTVTVKLKPGSYTFYCPVPGHRQAGMQGKLTVK
jgi:uncharacterized cupredoxin-like copper-binding protein